MEQKRSSNIDLLTLVIAAVAGAAAAYFTSKVWAGGTLVSAALTPVIVAIVKEALARPVDVVTSLRTSTGATGEQTAAPPEGGTPLHPPVTVYRRSSRRWIKVGIVSGLAAFALIVAVFTIPELVAGKSIGRSDGSATTLFGGKERESSSKKPSEEKAPATPQETATPASDEEETVTPSPEPTVTVTATPTVAPTVTVAPSASPAP